MNFFPPTLTKKKRIIRSQCESGLCSHLNQVDRKNRLCCCCCCCCLSPKVRVAKLTLILKVSLRKTPATKNELKTCPLLHCQISKSSLSCRPSVIDREVSFLRHFKKSFSFSTASILGATSPFSGKVGERKTNRPIITFSSNYTTVLCVTFLIQRAYDSTT